MVGLSVIGTFVLKILYYRVILCKQSQSGFSMRFLPFGFLIIKVSFQQSIIEDSSIFQSF